MLVHCPPRFLVYGESEGVDNAAEHALTYGDPELPACRLDGSAGGYSVQFPVGHEEDAAVFEANGLAQDGHA